MATEARTKSESLFEELCQQHGVVFTRLAECQYRQQPDYEIDCGSQKVVIEVKQIDPNEDDKRFTEALKTDKMASQCRNPDVMARRVRNHIRDGVGQIRSYQRYHPHTPSIIVLFDDAKNRYTDPYTIQTALHGWEQVVFDTSGIEQAAAVIERGFGPRNNKEIRPDKNQQLSALATLHEFLDIQTDERQLSLCFYHNPFANRPFDPLLWQGNHIYHMNLAEKAPGQFQNWKLFVAASPQERTE